MSNKKTCRRFKRTGAGRRCAKYGDATNSRRPGKSESKVCVRFQTTNSGKRCAKYGEKE